MWFLAPVNCMSHSRTLLTCGLSPSAVCSQAMRVAKEDLVLITIGRCCLVCFLQAFFNLLGARWPLDGQSDPNPSFCLDLSQGAHPPPLQPVMEILIEIYSRAPLLTLLRQSLSSVAKYYIMKTLMCLGFGTKL